MNSYDYPVEDYYDYYAPLNEKQEQALDASLRKAQPIYALWGISAASSIVTIILATAALIRNQATVTYKEMPYIGFLVANFVAIAIVEIPDLILYASGVPIHNNITSAIYDVAGHLPIYNLLWIAIQHWIEYSNENWLTFSKSLAIGGAWWGVSTILSILFYMLRHITETNMDFAHLFGPIYVTSFVLQKLIPSIFSIILLAITAKAMSATKKFRSATDLRPTVCVDLGVTIAISLMWMAQDVHVLIYLYYGYVTFFCLTITYYNLNFSSQRYFGRNGIVSYGTLQIC